MRPPILSLSIAFAAGLAAALNGVDLRVAACLVMAGAVVLCRAAPLGAALGVMLVAGIAWGGAMRRMTLGPADGESAAADARAHDRVRDPTGLLDGVRQHDD